MEFQQYKDDLLSYLNQEKELYEADIEANKMLSDEEKEGKGLLIRSAKIVKYKGFEYQFYAEVNNTKLRPGDKVKIEGKKLLQAVDGKVIENNFENIYIESNVELLKEDIYDIRIEEFVLIDPLISLAESITEYVPGSFFFKQLMGNEKPLEIGIGSIRSKSEKYVPSSLNEMQRMACCKALDRPSLYCIQGPPGTGKTDVLVTVANIFSRCNREVLIISNTHQAVNNALNKLISRYSDLNVVKIGEALKAQELDEKIVLSKSYHEYTQERRSIKKKKFQCPNIIGMTFYGAIFNLGLRNSGFKPSIILVDEAGQMPLAESSLIGSFGCGSVIFIGDDRQMPPIFHEKLEENPWSISIFEKLCQQYSSMKIVLQTTYRMNEEITNVVSRLFYEPFDIKLISSDYSKNRILKLNCECDNELINSILNNEKSIQLINVTTAKDCEDINLEEAVFVSDLVNVAVENGMAINDIAVITPYRRQVNAVRQKMLERMDEIPIIDTVERLQGQDVEMIIISFCASMDSYVYGQRNFLFQLNRLNVMISRAKTKVIILASDKVRYYLDSLKKRIEI